jgi:hypothetical protein
MHGDKKTQLKAKAAEELRLLLVIFLYLAVFFGAFLTYRRLLLREVGVSYFHYGYALIEALIIAKVILIGKALGVGTKVTVRSFIFSVLRLSVVYGILVGIFSVLEHVIEGLVHGKTPAASFQELLGQGANELLAKALVMFVVFIPFFAFWEVARRLEGEKLSELLSGKARP